MRYLLLIGFFFSVISMSAAKGVNLDSIGVQDPVYVTADIPPRFEGCSDTLSSSLLSRCVQKELFHWIFRQLKYPRDARESRTVGTAVSSFTVEKNGKISDIRSMKDPGMGLGAEAIRVIGLMNDKFKWIPAIKDGKAVRYRFVLPIKFRLDTGSYSETQDRFLVFKRWGGQEVFRGMVSADIQDAIPGKYIKNIETYDIPKSKAVYNVIGNANIVHFRPRKLARPQELMDLKSIIMDNLLPDGFAVRYNKANSNLIMTLGKAEQPLKLYIHNYIGEVLSEREIKISNGHIEKIDISQSPSGVLFVSLASERHFATALVVKD